MDKPLSTQQQAEEWFLKLRESPEDKQLLSQFEGWKALHPDHEEAYLDQLLLWHDLEVLDEASTSVVPPLQPISSKRKNWFSIAAAAVVLLATTLLSANYYWSDTARGRADYLTHSGQRSVHQLSDGSVIRLNANTAVDVNLTSTQRQITLRRGEAYFEVAKDSRRPFVVQAQGMRIQALGTAFNINLTGEWQRLDLVEGKVSSILAQQPETLLLAGEQLTWRSEVQQPVAKHMLSRAPSWSRHVLRVNNMTFTTLLDELNRQYAVRFQLLNPQLASLRVTATLPLSDVASAMKVLRQALGLHYVQPVEKLVLIY